MTDPTLPGHALKRLGRCLADVLAGALDHADMPPPPAEAEASFCQMARLHLAAIERATAPRKAPNDTSEDPA